MLLLHIPFIYVSNDSLMFLLVFYRVASKWADVDDMYRVVALLVTPMVYLVLIETGGVHIASTQ